MVSDILVEQYWSGLWFISYLWRNTSSDWSVGRRAFLSQTAQCIYMYVIIVVSLTYLMFSIIGHIQYIQRPGENKMSNDLAKNNQFGIHYRDHWG